jgi:phasin
MLPKIEVPVELRALAEKSIDQAEQAFSLFFAAANRSLRAMPNPATQISTQALWFSERNMKAAFDHARRLVQTTDSQQAMQLQSEFMKELLANAQKQMQQMSSTTEVKDKF